MGGVPALDTTFSDLRLVASGDTGTLYADATGATMQDPTPVTREDVPLVTVDLSETGPTPDGKVGLDWTGAETALTKEGVDVFGSYPEGEPFDPVSMALLFGTPQPDPEPEVGGEGEKQPDPVTDSKPELPKPLPETEPKGPAARIALVKGTQTLGTNRAVNLGTVACPSAAPCQIVAAKKTVIKVGGKRYLGAVLAPKWVAAGKSAPIRVQLPKRAATALAGHSTKVRVTVSVLANGNTTTQQLWVVVRT
jgi:hypothetical protein